MENRSKSLDLRKIDLRIKKRYMSHHPGSQQEIEATQTDMRANLGFVNLAEHKSVAKREQERVNLLEQTLKTFLCNDFQDFTDTFCAQDSSSEKKAHCLPSVLNVSTRMTSCKYQDTSGVRSTCFSILSSHLPPIQGSVKIPTVHFSSLTGAAAVVRSLKSFHPDIRLQAFIIKTN
ncbi:hypothetical protein STEG23_033181 [Scotinomys teguina]